MTGTGRVVALHTYPIKGCAGTGTADAALTPAGLAHDRAFMVVDDDGTFRSQRRDPRLATIRPEITGDGTALVLRAPGVDELEVPVGTTGPRRPVTLFGRPLHGVDQGAAAAGWLSHVLGTASRLVRVPPEHDRVTDGETPGTCAYADSAAVLVTSHASLAELEHRISARGADPVPMERFRANIVVDGWSQPHVEDRAREVRIGDAELAFTKIAIRCAVTTVDQHAGVRAGPEPLRTLADYRRVTDSGVAFGAKFAVVRPGRLAVGDELVVQRWA